MDKKKLTEGKTYLHKRTTTIQGVKRQAERWMRCARITKDGAVFTRDFEPEIILTNEQIQKELYSKEERRE